MRNKTYISSISHNKFNKLFFFIFCAFVYAFTSCSSHKEGGSVTSLLLQADSCIASGDISNALLALKDAEKQSQSVNEFLGVYKRYTSLGDDARTEKLLKHALRKMHGSQEVLAVYGNFLLKNGRVSDALKKTKGLKDSHYASIYAESFLRYALDTGKTADELFNPKTLFSKTRKKEAKEDGVLGKFSVFYDSRFVPVFTQAYRGSGIRAWLRNAAVLLMIGGQYEEAATLYPGSVDSSLDSLFWGTVFYDAGHYNEGLEVLKAADTLKPTLSSYTIARKSLQADVYYILGEDEEAEKLRSELLDFATPYITSLETNLTSENKEYPPYIDDRLLASLPVIYINSALYMRQEQDKAGEYERLHKLVTLFPEYEPGLQAYGEYALDLLNTKEDDFLTSQIRAAGLQTREMEKQALIPIVEVSEVLDLIESAINSERSSPRLIVLKEEINASVNPEPERARRAAKVWPLLERNEIEGATYPGEIAHYAIVVLINNNYDEEARTLFERYIKLSHKEDEEPADSKKKKKSKKSKSEEEHVKPFIPMEHIEELSLWECEVLAWFNLQDKKIGDAIKVYSFILEKYGARSPTVNVSGQNDSVIASYINLGNIYAASNQHGIALDYWGKASGRTMDSFQKADILYRMGKSSYYLGDYRSSIRSLQYSLKLDPTNSKARLMLQLVQSANNQPTRKK